MLAVVEKHLLAEPRNSIAGMRCCRDDRQPSRAALHGIVQNTEDLFTASHEGGTCRTLRSFQPGTSPALLPPSELHRAYATGGQAKVQRCGQGSSVLARPTASVHLRNKSIHSAMPPRSPEQTLAHPTCRLEMDLFLTRRPAPGSPPARGKCLESH